MPNALPDLVTAAAPRSDKDSDPVSLTATAVDVHLGAVLTGDGIEIKPARPEFGIVSQLSAAPNNTRAHLVFNREGQVTDARLIESTGYADIDGPLEASLYRWKASGPKLETIDGSFSIDVNLILSH